MYFNLKNTFFIVYIFTSCGIIVSSEIISLRTEADITENWNVNSSCVYYDESESICEGNPDYKDPADSVGYWTNCERVECWIEYDGGDESESAPLGISLRVYALATSHLILRTDFGEIPLPINTVGWGQYDFVEGFNGTKTLAVSTKSGEEIVIFDTILIKTAREDVTTSTLFPKTPESTTNDQMHPSTSPESTTADQSSSSLSILSSSITPESSDSSTTVTPWTTSSPPNPTDVLDTIDDNTDDRPWILDCVYGATIAELESNCRHVIPSDPEMKIGYWTPCQRTSCQIKYRDQDMFVSNPLEISLRAYLPLGSKISIRAGIFFIEYRGNDAWLDTPFTGGMDFEVISVTLSGPVVIDEVRVTTLEGVEITTVFQPITQPTVNITTPGHDPSEEDSLSELYLLLILIAVGLVILLMTLLIIITCVRRVCCRRRKRDDKESMAGDDTKVFRAIPMKVPVSSVTPPPGYAMNLQNDGSRGLDLQLASSSSGATLQNELLASRENSPYRRNGDIYFRGRPPQSNSLGERETKILPRLEKSKPYGKNYSVI